MSMSAFPTSAELPGVPSNGRWGARQLARFSALVTLYSLALRESLRVLGWTTGVSLVELALAIFFLAPIANAPSACSTCSGRRPRPSPPA